MKSMKFFYNSYLDILFKTLSSVKSKKVKAFYELILKTMISKNSPVCFSI